MEKRTFIISLLITIVCPFIAFLYDFEIVKFISTLRTMPLNYIFLCIVFVSNTLIVFFFLTTLFLWKKHKKRWIFPLWFASFFSVIVSYLLKIIIARPRPFQKGIPILQIVFHFIKDNFLTWNFSFPSFHAMLVFSALPFLSKGFKRFKYIWFIFACFVAFSRVYFGIHYLSDVLVGGFIGYTIGYIMVIMEEKYGLGVILMKKLGISK